MHRNISVVDVATQVSKKPAHGLSKMASQRLRQQVSFTQTLSVALSGLKLCHIMHTQRQAALGLPEKRACCAWKEKSILSKKAMSCSSDSMCSFDFCFAFACLDFSLPILYRSFLVHSILLTLLLVLFCRPVSCRPVSFS